MLVKLNKGFGGVWFKLIKEGIGTSNCFNGWGKFFVNNNKISSMFFGSLFIKSINIMVNGFDVLVNLVKIFVCFSEWFITSGEMGGGSMESIFTFGNGIFSIGDFGITGSILADMEFIELFLFESEVCLDRIDMLE